MSPLWGLRSCQLNGKSVRTGVYECYQCKRQFTITTKTPMHSTKLPLWKWLQAMYYIVNSSKGISSVILARWLGVTQTTAWKMGHAIRTMMDTGSEKTPLLDGIVELDEKYLGGKINSMNTPLKLSPPSDQVFSIRIIKIRNPYKV